MHQRDAEQHLTVEVLGSICSRHSKGAREQKDYYFAIKNFSKSDREEEISTLLSPKIQQKIHSIPDLSYSVPYFLPSGPLFSHDSHFSSTWPNYQKPCKFGKAEKPAISDGARKWPTNPSSFHLLSLPDSVSCFHLQKDDVLGFFYCMVSSRMYTWLPNHGCSGKIVFWFLSTNRTLNTYSPCI